MEEIKGYQGHIMNINKIDVISSVIIFCGIEDGRYVFTFNRIINGRISYKNTYYPTKIYETSKGEYVNVCGFRLYFKDLVDNYGEIGSLFR